MSNRFDLEQKMLEFMSIVEELEQYDGIEHEYIHALAKVYAVKADRLWNCFETMVTEREL